MIIISSHLEFQVIGNHLEPLTDQQLMGICNLQQSSQQAEDALSQGMEALQQSLVDTLSASSLGPTSSGNVADYMGQMALAMGKLATLENFIHQVHSTPHFLRQHYCYHHHYYYYFEEFLSKWRKKISNDLKCHFLSNQIFVCTQSLRKLQPEAHISKYSFKSLKPEYFFLCNPLLIIIGASIV